MTTNPSGIPAPTSPSAPGIRDGGIFRCWGTAHLRLLFLGPLAVAIVTIVLLLSVLLYQQERDDLQRGIVRIHASAQDFYEESIRYDAHALQAIMHTLDRDSILRSALAQGDRAALLQRAKPLFDDLRRDFNITHLYFTGPDRVNLLRVHTPPRHGDVIDRITMLQAEAGGTIAYGVELGPLGTFTLRLVSPWRDEHTGKLIGYVELGMEIDLVLNKLEDFFGVQVFTVIDKTFLQRDTWEAGMRTLGRTPHWEHFPNVVASEQSDNEIPPMLVDQLSRGESTTNDAGGELAYGGHSYRVIHLPLQDAGGRDVAQMILLADVTTEIDKIRNTIYVGGLAMFGSGAVLFMIFYWLVGKIGQRIEHDEKTLQDLAIRDGLTGLYNHRTFYSLLDDELKRALRHKRPLSLLMLDIDHFKRVNDTYGHRVGDIILHGLSKLLMGQARETDRVCRYGGEEIILILPEIDTAAAGYVAERLRQAVEAHVFPIGGGKQISITVSIGVAVYPKDADTKETLVAAADTAMYQAKQGGRNRVCVHAPPAEPMRSSPGATPLAP